VLPKSLILTWKPTGTSLQAGTPMPPLKHMTALDGARSLGFEYLGNSPLLLLSAEKRLERLEALVASRLENDKGARTAVLGTCAEGLALLQAVPINLSISIGGVILTLV
jgi:hypothetical protein